MSKTSRLIILVAALLPLLAFAFPLWEISLWAPQYPEGLSLSIWLSKITGDLDNINILNHYIGMKHITPASIPELSFMPMLTGGVIATGLLASLSGKKKIVGVWVALYTMLAVVGMVDFYKWEYDYGHDLSPDAPIKIPGMSYQPPLIGSEDLLNISALSLPGLGGYALIISLGLGFGGLLWDTHGRKLLKRFGVTSMLGVFLLLAACNGNPEAIHFGSDSCDHCKMTISDSRFGAEVITKTGKAIKFDSIDCLVKYIQGNQDKVARVFTVDFAKKGELVAADQARFLKSDRIRAPMGSGILSTGSEQALQNAQKETPGKVLEWKEVLASER